MCGEREAGNDVGRDVRQLVENDLHLRSDNGIPVEHRFRFRVTSCGLKSHNLGRKLPDGVLHSGEVHFEGARRLAVVKRALVQQVVELESHSFAVCLVDAESNRAERACEVRHVHRPLHRLRYNAFVNPVLERKEACDIGLRLLKGGAELSELLPYRRLPAADGNGVWPKAVHQLVRENVREERFKGDKRLLVGIKSDARDRHEHLFELCLLNVLQHHTLASLLLHDSFIVRQVERRRSYSLPCLSSHHDFIDHTDRRESTQLGIPVLLVDRKIVFDLLKVAGVHRQLSCLLIVPQRDERFERRFVVEQLIHIHFVRTDGRFNGAFQLHPCHIAVVVVVGQKRGCALPEEVLEGRVRRKLCRLVQKS